MAVVLSSGDEQTGFELAAPPVPGHLAPFVTSWTGYREWSARPVRRVEYPTGRAVLIFEFGPALAVGRHGAPLAQPGGFFAGIDDAPSITEFRREQAGVQVNLTVAGALAFGGAPLAREVVALEHLGLRRSVGDELASAASWPERFALVEARLQDRFAVARAPSALLSWAVQRIDACHGRLRVDGLAREAGFSRKHLHARFRDELGLSPKRYADVRRFARVLARLRADARADLATLALELGFADQPHLAREVRRFTGGTTRTLGVALDDPLARAVTAVQG